MTTNKAPAPHGRLAFVRRLLDDVAPVPVPEPEGPPGARRISALEPDPQRAGAVRLSIDGERFATIGREEAVGLRVGMPIDDTLEARIQAAADIEGALRSGLSSLARRGMARADLARRLRRKGHVTVAVDAAIERLAGLGLLDDEAYARAVAEAAVHKGRGAARVSRDLGLMGVDRQVAQEAIAGAGLREVMAGDGDAVRALASARLARFKDVDPQAAKRRLLGFLARRGFQGTAVNNLVRRLVAERERGAAQE